MSALDRIDHGLLMKAVCSHSKEGGIQLYIERWLTAPFETTDGERLPRERGVPQGGVVSSILMNLFMRYTFDAWMKRTNPSCPFARHADDALVHCRTRMQAEEDLPPELIKQLNLPRYKRIGASLLGRLARDLSYRGKGVGELLLVDALKRSLVMSRQIASAAVIVDAKDEKVQRFYRDFGFIPFPESQKRLFLAMATIQRLYPEI